MKHRLFSFIKCLSILLITGAIGLELWRLQAMVSQRQSLAIPPAVFWLASFALVVHFLEGVIAAVYASRQSREPFRYALYTFFVGTVGLVELFDSKAAITKPNQG